MVCENAGYKSPRVKKSVVGTAKRNLFKSLECPKFVISDVKCNGNEKKLEKCAFKVKYADCKDIEVAAGVVCTDARKTL